VGTSLRNAWLLAIGFVAIVTGMGGPCDAAAQERAGDPAKWRPLWDEMMRTYTDDRCYNCHTNTNVRTGDSHGGGELETPEEFACIGCHTANTTVVEGRCELFQYLGTTREGEVCRPDAPGRIRVPIAGKMVWNRLGPPFSMDAREMCQMVKDHLGPAELLEHMETDALIAFAFEGNAAMDAQSPYAADIVPDPPPHTKPEFIKLTTRWITEAAMACGTEGTVTFDDTVKVDLRSPFGSGAVRNETTASIKIEDDVATSELHYGADSTAEISTSLPLCPARESAESHFKADGKPETRYEINILPNDTFRMRFMLGSIEGQSVWSYKEQLCRPGTSGGETLPTELTTPLLFGVEDQSYQENADHSLVLSGSTTVPNALGEEKLTWRIVIK
jgi:predicted Rdx family selenoprotein